MTAFKTQTFGKWILAGEHAVLRGHPALAFPLLNRSLELEYQPSSNPLEVEFRGEHGKEMNLLFYGVIENAVSRLKIREPLTGKFVLTSALPVGAGLGASAALCGAVSRWCLAQSWIPSDQVYEFARDLEDLFHGESSGVDLAVSLSAQGIRFVRGGERQSVSPTWWPRLYLSYSGHRGMTSDCVAKVKRLFETDIKAAQFLDLEMARSVELAEKALQQDETLGRANLVESIKVARHCFNEWGLCTGDLLMHIHQLEEAGATAVKPTGSGGGGYVLSLWDDIPPASIETLLLPVPRPG